MSNEELMRRLIDGDESALDALCAMNRALVKEIAKQIAFAYNCYRFNGRGSPTAYTIEMLSDLESVGMTAFIECVRGGEYNPDKGKLSTYVYPFIEGAMRRYLEASMGTLAIDRDSMTAVRKAQEMYHAQQKSGDEIAAELGIPTWLPAKHIGYATHFFSV
jgi:DNA-directed RNA polymerase specialized sigma subunit